jgi:hypothetical protein
LLGDAASFKRVYQKPIDKGNAADSARWEQQLMQRRVHVLRKKIAPFAHRRDSSILVKELKREPQVRAFVTLRTVILWWQLTTACVR